MQRDVALLFVQQVFAKGPSVDVHNYILDESCGIDVCWIIDPPRGSTDVLLWDVDPCPFVLH